MRIGFALLLVLHGTIHLMGFAKGFGLAELPALGEPISRTQGLVWLGAAALLFGTAAALFLRPAWAWSLGAAGLVLSEIAIVGSWSDAKYGTAANLVVLFGVIVLFGAHGPWSLERAFRRDAAGLAGPAGTCPVTERDLEPLPPAVQRYLRLVGVVGRPRVVSYRVAFSGRIRSGPEAPWMSIRAEQRSSVSPAARLFFLRASIRGVPFVAYHRYVGPHATMRVRLASLVQIANARGPEMDRSETVTLFNDMCLLAPATLIDPAIRWRAIDARSVEAGFDNGGHSITAVLSFAEGGELVGFRSGDRSMASGDGRSFTRIPWDTPVSDYRAFGDYRLEGRGEARWHAPGGAFTYAEFVVEDVRYNGD